MPFSGLRLGPAALGALLGNQLGHRVLPVALDLKSLWFGTGLTFWLLFSHCLRETLSLFELFHRRFSGLVALRCLPTLAPDAAYPKPISSGPDALCLDRDGRSHQRRYSKRLELLDQQGLAQRNPYVIDQKIAAAEVRQIKIACGLNRGNMVA